MDGMKLLYLQLLQQHGSFHSSVATFLVICSHMLLLLPIELLISHLFACHFCML